MVLLGADLGLRAPRDPNSWLDVELGTGFVQGYVGYSCSVFSLVLLQLKVRARRGRETQGSRSSYSYAPKVAEFQISFGFHLFYCSCFGRENEKLPFEAFFCFFFSVC